MVRGRSLITGVTLVIAGVLVVTASGYTHPDNAGGQVQQVIPDPTTTSSLAAPASPALQTSSNTTMPDSSTLVSPTQDSASSMSGLTSSLSPPETVTQTSTSTIPTSVQATQHSVPPRANPLQPVPVPSDTSSFRLYIKTEQGKVLPNPSSTSCSAPVKIGVMDVPSYVTVTPPEPAGQDWCDTSVHIKASAYPSSPSTGTTYVYGHACAHHVCPFSEVRLLPGGGYSVQPGDQVVEETPTGTLTLQVCQVYSSPKDGSFKEPDCGGQTIDLVIIACEYEPGTSYDNGMNVVVAATLVASKKG